MSTRGPLRHQLADLCRGLYVERRRARLFQQDLPVMIARHADREPAHEAEILVGIDLEAQLADVEVECLVLVENVERRNRESVEHGTLLGLARLVCALTLDDVLRGGFSKTARSRPGHREAVGRGYDGPMLPIGAGGRADDIAKDAAERAEAGEADIETDVRHAAVRRPQQVHAALDPAALEIAMRGLAERRAERPDEVRLRNVGDLSQRRNVQRLRVSPVHRVTGTKHSAIELLDGPAHPVTSFPGRELGATSARRSDLQPAGRL